MPETAPQRARIAVFVSGRGSNMAALLYASRFDDAPYEIALVASNDPHAGGLAIAGDEDVYQACKAVRNTLAWRQAAGVDAARQEILDKDLSLLNFIESGFTYLNGRLASHYGIEGVVGQKFRRVKLPPDSMRGGLLTQASILKVTANGTYTSPVLRGVWVLENILGHSTSPPPDNVGAVEPDTRSAITLREQLAKHRDVKSCSACHKRIDPPGFALESFDPIGGFRESYRTMAKSGELPGISRAPFTWAWIRFRVGLPVDASGKMPDGESFSNIHGFKKLLLRDPDQLARNLARKLLTYATGRKISFADRRAVEEIVGRSREQGYGFRSLVHAVAQSELIRNP